MCHDLFVLRTDAWLGTLLTKNLQMGTLLLLVYGGVASLIVATLIRVLIPGH